MGSSSQGHLPRRGTGVQTHRSTSSRLAPHCIWAPCSLLRVHPVPLSSGTLNLSLLQAGTS